MKHLLAYSLLLLIILGGCKKSDTTYVSLYKKDYTLIYDKATDSSFVMAMFKRSDETVALSSDQSIMVNGIPMRHDTSSNMYYFSAKGLNDLAMQFNDGARTMTNTFKTSDVQNYEFINFPDTIYAATGVTLQWTGPDISTKDDIAVLYDDSVFHLLGVPMEHPNSYFLSPAFLQSMKYSTVEVGVQWVRGFGDVNVDATTAMSIVTNNLRNVQVVR